MLRSPNFNFVIVCDDAGEMKTISAVELDAWAARQIDENGNASQLPAMLNEALDALFDEKAIAEGDYDPSDNDTPIEVVMSGLEQEVE